MSKQTFNLIKYSLNCLLIVAIVFTLSIFTNIVLAEWREPDCADPNVCNVLRILSSDNQTQFKQGKLNLAPAGLVPDPNENDQLSVYANSGESTSAIYAQQNGAGYAIFASGKVGIGTGEEPKELCLNENCITEWPSAELWSVNGDDIFYDTGNVGVGIAYPNSRLHIYQASGVNAELDIQSVAGANEHWAIYQDRDTEDLKFWHDGGDNVLTLTNEGLVRVRNFATASLPTCDSSVLGAIVFDTDEDAHYACTTAGWGTLGSSGSGINPEADELAAVINGMSAADGASALEAMEISDAAAVVNSSNLSVANAAAIFDNTNISVFTVSDILDNSNLWASKAASVLGHANLDANRSQTVLYGMSSFAKIIDIITSGASDATFAANGSITGINRYATLTINSGITLTVNGQPGVIITSSLLNAGTIDKSKSGGMGGVGNCGTGGAGGGGIVVISKYFNNGSVIRADGGSGGNGCWVGGSSRIPGGTGGGGMFFRIDSDIVGDGGDGSGTGKGLGFFGGGGGDDGSTSSGNPIYPGGNGGSVSYPVTLDTEENLYTEQRKAVVDWWLVNVVVKLPMALKSFADAKGAGGGGGGSGSHGAGGGGAGGGSILILSDIFDNSNGTISADGGRGGNSVANSFCGGGGGGGIVYGLFRTLLVSDGAVSVEGGLGGDYDHDGQPGTAGTATIYDVSGAP